MTTRQGREAGSRKPWAVADLWLGRHLVAVLSTSLARPFLVCDDRSMGPREFLAAARDQARKLQELGVARGSVVWVVSGRGSQYWVDLAACWLIGAVVVPLGPKAESALLAAVGDAVPCAAALGAPDAWATQIPAPGHGFPSGEPPRRDAHEGKGTGDDSSEVAGVLFTSGSSGIPKGVVLTHRSLLGNALATAEAIPLFSSDRLAVALSFHYTSAICYFLAVATAGATLVCTERRLMPGDLAAFLREAEATCLGGAPLQVRWVADCASQRRARLRALVSSGDHLSVDVIELVQRRLPDVALYTVYGLTEVGGRFCVSPPSLTGVRPGSVGRPIRGLRVSVLDAAGAPASVGEVGEVWASGDFLLTGYAVSGGVVRPRLTQHGFPTGDLGHLDEAGFLYLAGRADDVFKRSGEKVSAVRIADALLALELFADVAVAPVEDRIAGHLPCAFVVMRPGVRLATGDVLHRLRTRLPSNHLPSRFVEVPEIPRTGSGKVRRRELQAKLGGISAKPGDVADG